MCPLFWGFTVCISLISGPSHHPVSDCSMLTCMEGECLVYHLSCEWCQCKHDPRPKKYSIAVLIQALWSWMFAKVNCCCLLFGTKNACTWRTVLHYYKQSKTERWEGLRARLYNYVLPFFFLTFCETDWYVYSWGEPAWASPTPPWLHCASVCVSMLVWTDQLL